MPTLILKQLITLNGKPPKDISTAMRDSPLSKSKSTFNICFIIAFIEIKWKKKFWNLYNKSLNFGKKFKYKIMLKAFRN
jgi:hypothetical protein